jgi:hypothetical protein
MTRMHDWAVSVCLVLPLMLPGAARAANPWDERSQALGQAGETVTGELDKGALDKLRDLGETLFTTRFTSLDGLGRPLATQAIVPTLRKHPSAAGEFSRTSGMDANACSSCHNEPVAGGAGDFTTNVFVSEGFESADFDSTDPQFSNERGTNHLFGSGLLELLAREMTAELQAERRVALRRAASEGKDVRVVLTAKGVNFGHLTASADGMVDMSELDGVDMDLVIRPFTQKGVMTSLRQFTVNAMNQHQGMEAEERFGARFTGSVDFDGDGIKNELSPGDISALVAWQATLPVPLQKVPDDSRWVEAARTGEANFAKFGCEECHKTSLPLSSLEFSDPGPVDVAGTLNTTQVKAPAVYNIGLMDWAKHLKRNEKGEYLVPLFGDLKRHTMTDSGIEAFGNELLPQRFVDRNIFMTAELWGVASTPPYGHRNDMTTLNEVILAHAGDARASRDAYAKAAEEDRSNLIAFLKTLVIVP